MLLSLKNYYKDVKSSSNNNIRLSLAVEVKNPVSKISLWNQLILLSG